MRPSRINPGAPEKGKIVRFRDGARHLPDFLASVAEEDEYPDLTFQEWMDATANRKLEGQAMSQAIGGFVKTHFVNTQQ